MRQPRPHGTRARYMMGPTGSDTANGCRCEPCRKANTAYSKRRAVRVARVGLSQVDATEVRSHIAWLRANGIGRRSIAAHADIDCSTVRRLTLGQATVRREIAERVLRINLVDATARYIDARPTRMLIDGLVADGWNRAAIAQALGQRSKSLTLASYGHDLIEPRNAARVDALVRRVAPHVWTKVHDRIAAERERSDARAAAAERRLERDRERNRARRPRQQRSAAA